MPSAAQHKHQNGTCVVSLIVDVDGKPENLRIFRCTDPIFADNSVAAVMKYRFKPAMTQDGKAVPVTISIEVNFVFGSGYEPPVQVRYELSSPPGTISTEPDGNGVYPLTNSFEPPNAAPKLVRFISKGFGLAALPFPDGVACDAIMTIDVKGKALDAQVTHCDQFALEKPAVESLLKSKYEAALLNGKAVPVRVSIHLAYAGFGPSRK